jgi:hypothetical protein
MKQIRRVLKIAVLTIAVTAGGAAAYLGLRRPAMPPPDVHAMVTPERLARGKYICSSWPIATGAIRSATFRISEDL